MSKYKKPRRTSSEFSQGSSTSSSNSRTNKNSISAESPKVKCKRERSVYTPVLRNPTVDRRVVINVNGKRFETYLATLNNFPETLLGSERKRGKYFDIMSGEIVLTRDQAIFEAVLFYYQSNGILAKPAWVSETNFEKELIFYELRKKKIKQRDVDNNKHRTGSIQMLWNTMEYPRSSTFALLIAIISILTITLSLIVFCLETVPRIINPTDKKTKLMNIYILYCIEASVIVWFTMEYILRIISSPKRVRFVFSFLGMVDVVVIIPFFVDLALPHKQRQKMNGFYVIRIIRMIRVFRIFKLTRYSTGLKVLGKTVVESADQLLALLLCLILSAVIFSSTIFFLEYPHYTKDELKFESIIDTFWYVFITMTTVGYGDVIPHTILGKLTASFCMINGIIVLLCLPTPVFITHFGRFYEDVVNRTPDEEEEPEDGDDQQWNLRDRALLVPTWFNDDAWKERIRNDTRINMFMPSINIYLSNTNIRKALSLEKLTHYDDVHR